MSQSRWLKGLFAHLSTARYKRFAEIGEGNRRQVLDTVVGFLDERSQPPLAPDVAG